MPLPCPLPTTRDFFSKARLGTALVAQAELDSSCRAGRGNVNQSALRTGLDQNGRGCQKGPKRKEQAAVPMREVALATGAPSLTLWVRCPWHMHTCLSCLGSPLALGRGLGSRDSLRDGENSRPKIQGAVIGSLGDTHISCTSSYRPISGAWASQAVQGCWKPQTPAHAPHFWRTSPEHEGPEW